MSQETTEGRVCASCGQPLPVQKYTHGRPVQYCENCRARRKRLSNTRPRVAQGKQSLNGKNQAAFAREQIDQARQAFADLPLIAREMLRYWISHAIAPAASLEPRDAASLKKDFSSEVCLVSVSQFVGAMLDAEYKPTLTGDGRWLFLIQRGNTVAFEDEPEWRYTLGRPSQRFHQLDIQLQEHTDLFGPLSTEEVTEEDVGES